MIPLMLRKIALNSPVDPEALRGGIPIRGVGQHDERDASLAANRACFADDPRGYDSGNLQQNGLNFIGRDLLATNIDHGPSPTCQVNSSVRVDPAQITGPDDVRRKHDIVGTSWL